MLNRIGFRDRSDITTFDLPAEIRRNQSINTIVSQNDQPKTKKRISDEQLVYWLNELGHNKTRVAEKLGVTYKTIWLRCKKLGL